MKLLILGLMLFASFVFARTVDGTINTGETIPGISITQAVSRTYDYIGTNSWLIIRAISLKKEYGNGWKVVLQKSAFETATISISDKEEIIAETSNTWTNELIYTPTLSIETAIQLVKSKFDEDHAIYVSWVKESDEWKVSLKTKKDIFVLKDKTIRDSQSGSDLKANQGQANQGRPQK